MLTAVDLFSGCGGMSLGFQNAGISIVAAFEYWEAAANCYEANFNHPVYRTDLSIPDDTLKIITALKPDLIFGGPPCQDFSHAGKRIEADRASLTESYSHIIHTIKPKYFIMENVDRALKSNAYASARKIFKDSGYGLTEMILDASKCGVPQKRKRFFCIGVLGEKDNVLSPYITKHLSKNSMTLKDYYGNSLGFTYYYRHPRNYNRRGIFSIDEPAPTIRGVNRPLPKGYPGHPNDACPLSPEIRALTTVERALVQTFPKNFIWTGTKTDLEQMIGNAVPVKLAEYVANALIAYIADNETVTSNSADFQTWLIDIKQYKERSAKDVISRCKRANIIYSLPNRIEAYYFFMLEQQDSFQQLSPTVKSQLKRAVTLLKEFKTESIVS